jgi:hypothetical protein
VKHTSDNDGSMRPGGDSIRLLCLDGGESLTWRLGTHGGGQRERVEGLWRDCKVVAIPRSRGWGYEAALDLAIRQQAKILTRKGTKI